MLNATQRDLVDFRFTRESLITQTSGALSGYDSIRNDSDSKILGVFKSSQHVCTHVQAVNKVEAAFGEMNLQPEITDFQLLKNGANLYIHYRLPEALSIDLGEGLPGVPGSDVLVPEIILRNGYDGRTTFGLEYGLFRLVCSNGMRTLVVGNRATAKQFMGDVDIAVIVAGIKEFCEVLLINLHNRLTAMVANMSPTLQSEVREWIISHWSNRLIGVWDSQMEYAEKEASEAGKDGVSEFQIYNACTFIITHMMNSYARRRLSEIQIAKQFNLIVRSNASMTVDSEAAVAQEPQSGPAPLLFDT